MKNRILLISAVIVAIGVLAFLLGRTPSDDLSGKIIIAEGSQPIAAPIYVAYAKGYFKEEGLNVELLSFPTGKLCLDALIGGKADFATAAETPIMHATFAKQPVKIVATIHRAEENTFCVARKSKGINAPNDLKGKTIAIPIGTNAEYGFYAFLNSQGIKANEVKLLNLSPPEMIGPFSKGNVDAVVGWQPHIGRCEASAGKDTVVFSFKNVYQETYNLVTNNLLAEEKQEITVKVLKALDKAIQFMQADSSESIRIVATRLGMDTAELTKLWPIYHFGLDLKPKLVETMEKEGQWAIEQGQHNSKDKPDNMSTYLAPSALDKAIRKDSVHVK